jgi:hypothetical protein
MKWLVWFLVFLNIGLLAYFNMDVIAPKPILANKSISPEKLKVLTEKELEALPKKVVEMPAQLSNEPGKPALAVTSTSCYKWGNFTSTNLPSAQVVLVRLGLQATATQESGDMQDRRYWVYYPPLSSAELARKKADEIRALGVDELSVVQDSQWRNAISFGLFNEEQLATNLLNALHQKGVKGATKALRNPGKALSSLLIQNVTPDAAMELHKIKQEFLGTDLTPSACS